MDAKQVMQLAVIVAHGLCLPRRDLRSLQASARSGRAAIYVMCSGTGARSDRRMRHYILQIQDDASLALDQHPDTARDQNQGAIGAAVEREG